MSRIKLPWWVFRENCGGNNYRDLEKMLLKAYKLGIKHNKEELQKLAAVKGGQHE
jgi:hypothetical protein